MKYGCYEYSDLPDSYRKQANCSICENLNLTKSRTNYDGKKECYCKSKCKFVKPQGNVCNEALISTSNYSRLGSYTPSGLPKCYITTIVCEILGYADDCELLSVLRDFREKYLKVHPEYLSLLLEYDHVGPQIAEGIRNEENNYKFGLGLLQCFLIPCVDEIKKGNYETAIEIYTNMVNYLKDEFEIPSYTIPENVEYDLETLGKGRTRIKPSEI
jgi:hypothetical protein